MLPYKDGLETERLTTRFLTVDDIPAWIDFFSDPENCTYITLYLQGTVEDKAAFMIEKQLARYKENILGMQALITKDTNEFIGMCGLLVQEVSGKTELEVGYHLLRRFWGRGYATEAAQMFRDYGFKNSDTESIVSIIHPDNTPSKNVAKRNGMMFSERGMFKGEEYDVFRIARQKWEQQQKINSH